jgi:ABC-type glycerol-3-phosphate transport system substrate-binding protein
MEAHCGLSLRCGQLLHAERLLVLQKRRKRKVTIYTSIEDYRIEYLSKRLEETFPNYDVNIVFYSTGDHIAKLLAEGTDTDCDITHSLGYSYLQQLDEKGVLPTCPPMTNPSMMKT